MAAWRRVCSSSPLRASTSSMASSALEAPVAMLRVYCWWPGVSATTKARLGVEKKRYATSMVMPCSRSASSPSSSSAKSMPFSIVPKRRESFSSDLIWSSNKPVASLIRRPISVDLPSSTDPQARKRNSLRLPSGSASLAGGASVSGIRSIPPASCVPWKLAARCRPAVPAARRCVNRAARR